MDFTNETIVGFLTGTVATIVLKGVIDFFQKRVEFKREIKKAVHGKKLEAAEHAIKAMFQSYQSTLIIITAIDNLLNRDMDGELFEHIWESYFKHIEQGEENLLTSTASLYFTLEDEQLWSDEDQKELFEIYSNVKILGEEIQYCDEEIESLEDEQEQNRLEEYVNKEFREPLKLELKKLIHLLRKNSNAVFLTIQKIKAEFQN